jgi:hypothetical protein
MELTILGGLLILLGVFAYALIVALIALFLTMIEEPPSAEPPPKDDR